MNFVQSQSTRVGFWAILFLSIFAWAPATYPGYWQSLEGFVPIFNAISPSPIANIATTPDIWQGMGSGTFLFVQPFIALGLSAVTSVRIVFILSLILGSLGIYTWLLPTFGDRAAGLGGLIYLFFPPFLATIYIRGSLSDAIVLGLFPLTLAGIAIYAKKQSLSAAAIAGISLLWIWQTQAGLALFVTGFLLLYACFVERSRYAILLTIISGIAGMVSTIPLWSYQAPTHYQFREHFLYFFQLFGNHWQIAPSIPGWQDQYPFQLGFAACGYSIVGLWFLLKKNNQEEPLYTRNAHQLLRFSYLSIVILIALSLQGSELLWQWSSAERLLRYPWQILLLSGPFFAVTAGSLPLLSHDLHRKPYWFALVILALLSSYPYLTTNFTQIEPPARPLATFGPNHNFVVLDAILDDEITEDQVATLNITWQILHPLDFDYNVFFQAARQDSTQQNQPAEIVAQLDAQPLNGNRPITTWQIGEILNETYRLDLSSLSQIDGDEPVVLTYYFGYYDWRDGRRLPIDDGLDDKMIFYGQ